MGNNVVDPVSVGMCPDRLHRIDELVEKHMSEDAYQGIVILVARHGKICYFKSFGKADEGKPMETNSIFRLASMSKVPTAVAVLQLWERGLIGLHDPIADYIPAFKEMKVAEVDDNGEYQLVDAVRPITIHHLLTMTAGMTNSWWDEFFDPPVYKVVPKIYAEVGIRDDMNCPDMTLEENINLVAKALCCSGTVSARDHGRSSTWNHNARS